MNPVHNPKNHNPEWTQSRMDTISNGHDSERDTILNGHNSK